MAKVLKKLNYVENLNLFVSKMQSSNWINDEEPSEPLIEFNVNDVSYGFVIDPKGLDKATFDNWLSNIEVTEGFTVLMKDINSESSVEWGVLVFFDGKENTLFVVTHNDVNINYSPSTGWIIDGQPITERTVVPTLEHIVLSIEQEFSTINGIVIGNNIIE